MSNKANSKLENLYTLLKTGPKTLEELIEATSWSARSVKSYIGKLRDEKGCNIESKKFGDHYAYVMAESENTAMTYEPITLDILRKYAIIRELQNGPVLKDNLAKCFCTCETDFDKIPIDVGQTKFYELLNQLIENGEIVQKKEYDAASYYLTGKDIPLIWQVDDSSLANLYTELQNITPGTAYYDQLYSVRNKLRAIYDPENTDEFSSNHIVFGKEYQGLANPPSQLALLKSVDYYNYCVDIEHANRHGYTVKDRIAIGLVIYSVEKDKFYILADSLNRTTPDGKTMHLSILLSSVKAITQTEDINECFMSKYYSDLYSYMFSVSTEEPQDVEVIFHYDSTIKSIPKKINNLLKLRKKTASLKIDQHREGDKTYYDATYTDKICGLADFQKYLRKFGWSAEVIKPLSLREKLLKGVNRTLSRYEQEENHE